MQQNGQIKTQQSTHKKAKQHGENVNSRITLKIFVNIQEGQKTSRMTLKSFIKIQEAKQHRVNVSSRMIPKSLI